MPVEPNEQAKTRKSKCKENITKPPARYTEATLLSAMEGAGKLVDDEELREAMSERGLGTPATRAQIIEGLISKVTSCAQGRELDRHAKGLSLDHAPARPARRRAHRPELTGEWEFKLRADGTRPALRDAFMQEIRKLTSDIVDKVKGHQGEEIKGDFKPLEVTCPRCGASPSAETFRNYKCEGCGLSLWKTIASRELERDEVAKLLTDGKVGRWMAFGTSSAEPLARR